jgi:hypothetical protein
MLMSGERQPLFYKKCLGEEIAIIVGLRVSMSWLSKGCLLWKMKVHDCGVLISTIC